eukprot:747112-Hanusia_phi.AAC.4
MAHAGSFTMIFQFFSSVLNVNKNLKSHDESQPDSKFVGNKFLEEEEVRNFQPVFFVNRSQELISTIYTFLIEVTAFVWQPEKQIEKHDFIDSGIRSEHLSSMAEAIELALADALGMRWGTLVHHIVNMLIVSITDPEEFFRNLFELTVRHIRYGVRAEYLSPFGQALIAVLEDILADSWTEKSEKAWKERKCAYATPTDVEESGKQHVTRPQPWGQRHHPRASRWRCRRATRRDRVFASQPESEVVVSGEAALMGDVDVHTVQLNINGATLSPLYWALHDGKYPLVEFILRSEVEICGSPERID